MDGVPSDAGESAFDSARIAPLAVATRREPEVVDTGAGRIMQIATELADDLAEGRTGLLIHLWTTGTWSSAFSLPRSRRTRLASRSVMNAVSTSGPAWSPRTGPTESCRRWLPKS